MLPCRSTAYSFIALLLLCRSKRLSPLTALLPLCRSKRPSLLSVSLPLCRSTCQSVPLRTSAANKKVGKGAYFCPIRKDFFKRLYHSFAKNSLFSPISKYERNTRKRLIFAYPADAIVQARRRHSAKALKSAYNGEIPMTKQTLRPSPTALLNPLCDYSFKAMFTADTATSMS